MQRGLQEKARFCSLTVCKLAEKRAADTPRSGKTNNEAAPYANCKMFDEAVLQVFKMLLQNAKPCASFTKSKTRFCEKRLIFLAR